MFTTAADTESLATRDSRERSEPITMERTPVIWAARDRMTRIEIIVTPRFARCVMSEVAVSFLHVPTAVVSQ